MNFSVGQVIYLLTKKDPKVYPALVCEEIQKKSLNGKTTSYVVRLPTDDSQEIELDKLDTEVFTGVNEARVAMIARATEQINFILKKAEEISEVFSEFVIDEKSDYMPESIIHSDSIDESEQGEDYATVDLGDGNVARINVKDMDKIREGR